MKRYRIGLIGLGGMAESHIREIAKCGGAEVAAICDVNAEALVRVGERLAVPPERQYGSYRQLIADSGVDAVVSVTPNHVHAEIVEACLLAGKPFMAEKPFTRTFGEAERLLKLYEREPVPCMIGFSYRYTPAFRYVRELILTGKIGAVRHFFVQYLQGWGAEPYETAYSWRFDKPISGTGTLGDLGSHMIDMARYLIGEFAELSAQLGTIVRERQERPSGQLRQVEVDDFASFQARMNDGALGVFQTSRNAIGSGNQHEVSVYGELGTLHASTERPEEIVWIRGEEKNGYSSRTIIRVPESVKTTQWADFIGLLNGSPGDRLPVFLDGYRNQQVLDAVIRSDAERRSVSLA